MLQPKQDSSGIASWNEDMEDSLVNFFNFDELTRCWYAKTRYYLAVNTSPYVAIVNLVGKRTYVAELDELKKEPQNPLCL